MPKSVAFPAKRRVGVFGTPTIRALCPSSRYHSERASVVGVSFWLPTSPYLPQPQIFRETAAFLHLHSCRHKYANNAIVNVKCVRLCVNYLSIDVECRISRDSSTT